MILASFRDRNDAVGMLPINDSAPHGVHHYLVAQFGGFGIVFWYRGGYLALVGPSAGRALS